MAEQLFVTLGSNIEPERNLPTAVRRLKEVGHLQAVSNVYQNPAVGPDSQPDYLNAAVLLETDLPLREIRSRLRRIERDLGRVRTSDKYAPRTIDLDVSLLGDRVVEEGDSHVPDPDIVRRAYLAATLAELEPRFQHPVTHQTLAAIANQLRPLASLTIRQDVTRQLRTLLDSEVDPTRSGKGRG